MNPFFPLFSVRPSSHLPPIPPGDFVRQVSGNEKRRASEGWYLTLGKVQGEELEKRGKNLIDGQRKGSRGNFDCFES